MSFLTDSAAQDRWEALLDGVLADGSAVEDIVSSIREAIPLYREVPDDDLQTSLATAVRRVVLAARAHRQVVNEDELNELGDLGRARVAQGIPADQMLLAWRIGFQVVIAHGRGVAERLSIDASEMLEFVQSLLAWSDRAMVVVAGAHAHAALDLARAEQETRGGFVRGLLLGTLAPDEIRAQAAVHDVDTTRDFVAIRARPPDEKRAREVRRELGLSETLGAAVGLSAMLDGDLVALLPDVHASAGTTPLGVGPPRPLERLSESFAAATRALDTAIAFGLEGIQRFDALGVLPAVVDDTAVGDALRRRYVEPLAGGGPELASSLRAWFACGMHIERAATELFVHQNTLRYRINRFEELTGADLKDPVVAFEVWWALQRDRL